MQYCSKFRTFAFAIKDTKNSRNCTNKGKVKNEYSGELTYTGGIAGMVYGKIENSYNIEDVTGIKNIGGILGASDNFESSILNCYSIGNISGEKNIGDIVGGIDRGDKKTELINCYTKDQTFTAKDLGDAFTDDENYEYPILDWEQN